MIQVLLADNNYDYLEYLTNLINWEKMGFKIVGVCHDGEELVRGYQCHYPQLVITEVELPTMSGIDAAKEMKGFQRYTEIIFISKNENFDSVRAALEIGASNYFIKKEINEKLLAQKLEEIKIRIDYQKNIHRYKIENDIAYLVASLNDKNTDSINKRYRQNYNVLLVEQDHFLPLFSDVFHMRTEEVEDTLIKNICYSLSTVMAVLKIAPYQYLILSIAEEKKDYSVESCYHLKNELLEKTGSSFSVFILSEHTRMRESIQQYHLMKNIVEQKYFCNSSSVISFMFFKKKKTQLVEFDNDRLEQALEDVDFDFIFYYIDQSFIHIINNMDYESFSITMQCFIDALEKRSGNLVDMRSGEVFDVYSQGDEENWYLIIDTIQWLKRKYKKVGQIILSSRIQNHSKEVAATMRYIYKHYKRNDLCIDDIAEYVKLSTSRLSAVFKREMNMSILQFLTEYRITKAKQLLEQNEIKITEIHSHIGYTSAQYFSCVFKKENNMTPMEYKKRGLILESRLQLLER